MKIERSTVIDRPPVVVFDFVGRNHVRNHPRWDPSIELEQVTDGPIGPGTVIRRLTSRGSGPVEGRMEIVGWEPDRLVTTHIQDGPLEMYGRMVVEPLEADRTSLTIEVEIRAAPGPIEASMIERSLRKVKELIERET